MKKKLRCALCGKEFEPPNGFCLTSMRGTNSNCDENCVVVCDECFRMLRDTFKQMEEDKKQLEEIPKIPPVWYIYRCDKCGCKFSLPVTFTPKFCPRCGEKME